VNPHRRDRRDKDIAIFGEMPSESGWQLLLKRCKTVEKAERVAERLACSGVIGRVLADLAGEDATTWNIRRFNLNARWHEQFDETEAAISASALLTNYPEIKRIICLGRNVGTIMGFHKAAPFLSVRLHGYKAYLLFPHPSGRNRWFNDAENKERAAVALREFLQ
jgi:hypothetical protein